MRLGPIFTRMNPFNVAHMDMMDDKAPLQSTAVAAPAKPAPSFEEKLEKYAKKGRDNKESIFSGDDLQFALKPAAARGDTDFLREALSVKNPDLGQKKNYWLLKETLTQAIINQHPQTVDFLLNEIQVTPYPAALESHGYNQTAQHPQWDALFVAATGIIPTNFKHEPGTNWNNPSNAGVDAIEIFDMVLARYTELFSQDPEGLLEAVNRQFQLPDNTVISNGEYNVISSKRSYASTPTAARPNLAPVLNAAIRSLNNKIAIQADTANSFIPDGPA